MSERTKRILLIVGFILSVVVIAFLLYVAFFRADSPIIPNPQTGGTNSQGTNTGLPASGDGTIRGGEDDLTGDLSGLPQADEVAKGGLTQTSELTTGPVYNPTLSGDGASVNFYDKNDGKFYRINADGTLAALSDKKFPGVDKATWNKDAEKAVLEYPDGSNVVYDFGAEAQVTLPKHWEGFDFSPVADELAAKSVGLDPNNRSIVVTNADGSNVKSIQPLGTKQDKVQVNWSPNDQVVAFSDTAQDVEGGIDQKIIYPIGKNQENFKGLAIEGLNFASKWSPDGKQLLYSASGSYSNYRPLLWVVDGTSSSMGKNRRSLSLNTWVEKCTFASTSVAYCAVPQNLPENAGLQPSLFSNLPDSVYKLDITTGISTLVGIPAGGKMMSNLFVTKDGSLLYYTDNTTGRLETMKLK
ncbi:MAG: hypothetical protein AAB431_01895 [Patescibacteria group bacterium]